MKVRLPEMSLQLPSSWKLGPKLSGWLVLAILVIGDHAYKKMARFQQNKVYQSCLRQKSLLENDGSRRQIQELRKENKQLLDDYQELWNDYFLLVLSYDFEKADTNSDNLVSPSELKTFYQNHLELNPEVDPATFVVPFEDFDIDHDGMITFVEQVTFFRNEGKLLN